MKEHVTTSRKYLLISTLSADNPLPFAVREEFSLQTGATELILSDDLKISPCIGCNDCWIKTPGLCCIKDDYEPILIKMLQSDCIIFLAQTKLGFVSSKMKNLLDRILPLLTMHLTFKNGQMCHYSRYRKAPDMALLYRGDADREFLTLWLGRVQKNLHGKSFGAYEIDGRKELYHALDSH